MKVIYKYPLKGGDVQVIEMPENAHILSIQCQGNEPQIWALVDPDKPTEERTFRIFGTGHELNGFEGAHIATFQQPPFVWHVFE